MFSLISPALVLAGRFQFEVGIVRFHSSLHCTWTLLVSAGLSCQRPPRLCISRAPPPLRSHHLPRGRSSSLIAPGKSWSGRRLQLVASSSSTTSKMALEYYMFGPYKIDLKEVFYSTNLSYALVNLRPVVPGHVLVCPKREVKRFADLTADEVTDLWLTAQKIGNRLEEYHKASSLTLTLQDGHQAGQTVPHVHVHILPRKSGDFEKNDEIYDAIDEKEKEMAQKLDLDKERKDRTPEEMAQEANEYRALFS